LRILTFCFLLRCSAINPKPIQKPNMFGLWCMGSWHSNRRPCEAAPIGLDGFVHTPAAAPRAPAPDLPFDVGCHPAAHSHAAKAMLNRLAPGGPSTGGGTPLGKKVSNNSPQLSVKKIRPNVVFSLGRVVRIRSGRVCFEIVPHFSTISPVVILEWVPITGVGAPWGTPLAADVKWYAAHAATQREPHLAGLPGGRSPATETHIITITITIIATDQRPRSTSNPGL